MDKFILFVITLILGHTQAQQENLEHRSLKNEIDNIYQLDQKNHSLLGDTITKNILFLKDDSPGSGNSSK
ncbi:MAG: hypothetical protein WBL21_11195 [Salinimicrobium sp.]